MQILTDPIFKERIKENMIMWERVRAFQTDESYGSLVKSGIKRIALERNRELNKEKREKLNLLILQQTYLTSKLQNG